jgi:MATE family multidrug resistance protein
VSVTAYLIDGFAYATETCAGQLYGQGDTHALRHLLKVAISMSIMTAIVVALLFNAQSQSLLGLLTSHQNIVSQSTSYVGWLFPVLGFGAIAYILDGYFLGLAAGRVLRNSSLIATLVGFMPMAMLSWQQQNLQMLWLAMTMFMAARALTLSLQLRRFSMVQLPLTR